MKEKLYKWYSDMKHMQKKWQARIIAMYNVLLSYACKQPLVVSIDETLDYIATNKCSVSRFGDGEYYLINGMSTGFQQYSDRLSVRLLEVLNSNLDNHIICLPDIFGDISYLRAESIEINQRFLSAMRHKILQVTPKNRIYYNSFFTRCYNMFADKGKSKEWFDKNKRIWDNQDILLVEGCKSRLGVGNDLFSNCKSIQRILAPAENAFKLYEQIFEVTSQNGRGKLILLALGMTATVLAFDLAKVGFWSIDIGHIDIEYEWFLRGTTDKILIPNKYVNEVKGGANVLACNDAIYNSQIIADISGQESN